MGCSIAGVSPSDVRINLRGAAERVVREMVKLTVTDMSIAPLSQASSLHTSVVIPAPKALTPARHDTDGLGSPVQRSGSTARKTSQPQGSCRACG
jgi:hypothetical protein